MTAEQADIQGMTSSPAVRPTARDVFSRPLPELGLFDRALLRCAASVALRKTASISGLRHLTADNDPFILALNHSTRLEALLIPPLLVLLRGGRRLHFLADWNFRLIPGVGLLYWRSGAITVPHKSARPRVLNLLKPLFTDAVPPWRQAAQLLRTGHSIGVFPEGTVNREPSRLLAGRTGAARLSLETGAPVVPAGVRFPTIAAGTAIPEGSPMEIIIGEPLRPPYVDGPVAAAAVRAWHARIMGAIGVLSGKSTEARAVGDGR